MKFSPLFAAAAAAVTCVTASPVHAPHAIHEKRSIVPHGWTKQRAGLNKDAVLPMRIGLTQSNLDKAYEHLMDVSHPTSDNFGKHWTAKQVKEMFAPSEETVQAVKTWLTEAGISEGRISKSDSGSWLKFDATVEEAESLLKTTYHKFEHGESGQPHIACDEYSIPAHLKDHIDLVTPSVHFDAKIVKRKEDAKEKRTVPGAAHSIGKPWTQPGLASLPKLTQYISPNNIIQQLQNCSNQIVPNCLRALYEFPPNLGANPKNSYGIVEYTPQAYVPSDLDNFFRNFSTRQIGDRPILDSIDGGVVQQTNMSFNFNGESNLDLEYAMTLVYPQKVTLYQVGDTVEGASFNNFLDAIDGSYCTYEGGDDPTQDGVYPDPLPGGYTGPENCGGFAATKVISTSYGYNEADLTPFYEQRQCNEYMKLGLMGVSVLYSSGDYGVAGNGGQCLNPNGTFNNGTSGKFNPSFPATCPYVTAVGATQVKPGTNIITDLATGVQPEQACETVIYSGGGFSNNFAIPQYQADAVNSWFENHPPPYGADRFNNSRTSRGYPDISANGANYVIAIDGQFGLVYGTSASSPTLGSILTLVNELRLTFGKSSIGFINPTIYAHPNTLNDITEGGNQGCGTPGFSAATGWDPVTGLGTPNFPKLVALWLGLP
ncbi:subtilisin-like protein [Myriangium duriaei CBS 260.36]|uniref:tripeptidyl-peptidase II n=1 Tax=Myriangium duriaei CBS 260.36 TaxID=1168546 RepID=A0A9P4MKB2_9PEZI|nr:subtilisin-like protein [Myriangium duriaei CBS 260.36]